MCSLRGFPPFHELFTPPPLALLFSVPLTPTRENGVGNLREGQEHLPPLRRPPSFFSLLTVWDLKHCGENLIGMKNQAQVEQKKKPEFSLFGGSLKNLERFTAPSAFLTCSVALSHLRIALSSNRALPPKFSCKCEMTELAVWTSMNSPLSSRKCEIVRTQQKKKKRVFHC